jgi:hypothetical protein
MLQLMLNGTLLCCSLIEEDTTSQSSCHQATVLLPDQTINNRGPVDPHPEIDTQLVNR